MRMLKTAVIVAAIISLSAVSALGEGVDAKVQQKIDAKVKEIRGWASDPVLVGAAKEQNAKLPDEAAAMTQEKWKTASLMDPFVRGFTKNGVGQFLKSKKDDLISEAFASSADGKKIGFLSKTTNWSHLGKPKHDQPMKGQVWQGEIEVDESTGAQQIQVAVPILDGDKPVGSLVVGLNASKLKE